MKQAFSCTTSEIICSEFLPRSEMTKILTKRAGFGPTQTCIQSEISIPIHGVMSSHKQYVEDVLTFRSFNAWVESGKSTMISNISEIRSRQTHSHICHWYLADTGSIAARISTAFIQCLAYTDFIHGWIEFVNHSFIFAQCG